MARALTEQERKTFEAIREAGNAALVQASFEGEDTAVIAFVNEDGDDYLITPVAVMLTDSMFASLSDPTED